jgi:hypothetical protein
MKKVMRIFMTIALAAALFLMPATAFAREAAAAVYTAEAEDKLYASADVVTDEDGEHTDNVSDGNTENLENELGDNADDADIEDTKNSFEKIYDAAMAHVSEILSLAAFIGSLICAVIYKSGLMPLIEKGLGGIKNAAQKIKEATDRAECDNKASLGYINDKMCELEMAISEMQETIKSATKAMESSVETRAHQARIDGLLSGELDMLYDIFMSSALPEYEKARVGERVAKLKEELNSDENEK